MAGNPWYNVPRPTLAGVSGRHVVKPGETLQDILRQYGPGFMTHPRNSHHINGTMPLLPGTRLFV